MMKIDTAKVKSIASEMIDINNRYKEDFSSVEQAVNRLKSDWQQPENVATAAFACFDEIKAKFFDSSISERQQLAEYLCNAVGLGYEDVENANKSLLEGLFEATASPGTSNTPHNGTINTVESSNENTNSSVSVNTEKVAINESEIAQYNSSHKKDDNYISGGCLVTSISNLYRRKQATDNLPQSEWINKTQVYKMNNNSAYYSDSTSSKLFAKTGYEMQFIETNGGLSIDKLSELLKDRPEGICVSANGDNTRHSILITSIENGKIMVVDPSDGGNPKMFSETMSVKYKSEDCSIFYGWSQEKLLSNITSVRYIK